MDVEEALEGLLDAQGAMIPMGMRVGRHRGAAVRTPLAGTVVVLHTAVVEGRLR
jgi:hypothetical protein